jgi:hypothetical protein
MTPTFLGLSTRRYYIIFLEFISAFVLIFFLDPGCHLPQYCYPSRNTLHKTSSSNIGSRDIRRTINIVSKTVSLPTNLFSTYHFSFGNTGSQFDGQRYGRKVVRDDRRPKDDQEEPAYKYYLRSALDFVLRSFNLKHVSRAFRHIRNDLIVLGTVISPHTGLFASIGHCSCQLVCLAPLSTKVLHTTCTCTRTRSNTLNRLAVALRNDHIRIYDLNLQGIDESSLLFVVN